MGSVSSVVVPPVDTTNAQNHRVAAGDVDYSFRVDGNSACIFFVICESQIKDRTMQDMSKALSGFAEKHNTAVDVSEFAGVNPEVAELQKVAGEWAAMSVYTFSGELLDRALEVSKAIAAFTMEFGTPGSSGRV